MKTVAGIIQRFKDELGAIYSQDELQAILTLVLGKYCGLSRTDLITKQSESITDETAQSISGLLNRLLKHEPIQYVLSEAWFMGMRLEVNKHVLIPRPETEELVEWILSDVKAMQNTTLNILDVCTGSGCIALSLKRNIPSAIVSAYDIQQSALSVAKRNSDELKLSVLFKEDNALNPVSFHQNDTFDIIVSNPPYIGIEERGQLEKTVSDYEPKDALFVEGDVLRFYKEISEFAKKHLSKTGFLYFEINQKYSVEMENMLKEKGYDVVLKKDLSGNYRMVRANF